MPMSDYMKEVRSRVGPLLLEVPSVSVVVRDTGGRVLLGLHSNGGKWVTPGGAVEPLETPADAAVRETWEETGILVELSGILGVYGGPEFLVRYPNGDQASYLIVVFEACAVGGALRADGDEILEVGYFDADAVPSLDTPPWLPEILRDAFDGTRGGFRRPTWSPERTS